MKRRDGQKEKKDVKGGVRPGNSKWRKRRERAEMERRTKEKRRRRRRERKKRKIKNGWKREQKVGATNVTKSATIESDVKMCLLQRKGLNKMLTTIFTVNANCLLINSK